MEPNRSAPEETPNTIAPTYPSKFPGRKRSTRSSNPHPCKSCKKSHLGCNMKAPYSIENCKRCSLNRLICEQPGIEDNEEGGPSTPDVRYSPYQTPPRRVTRRRTSDGPSAEARRTIAQSSAQVMLPHQNMGIPPRRLPSPPTQTVADSPTVAPFLMTHFIPPATSNAYPPSMGGGMIACSLTANYDISLGSPEIPMDPRLDQWYMAWSMTNTHVGDPTGAA
ncbi:hypothetical protein BD410DRAFT_454962 [Rickenella mellea]|uniref:Zn(2)-C6 fungal-type domain-containing protein n=1 Tax=Rickenella mellea TaxID=50990 RepID=A0A4Y7PUZ7_9AGAM|nr:hypothetical protein BD410DRAFT_454962 [Rickenella mellea]